MRKISLLLFGMIITVLSFSQSLSLVSKDTVIIGVVCGIAGPANAVIKNVSGATLTLKCKRTTINMVSGNTNYFCWVLCYGPGTDISPTGISTPSDSTRANFEGYLNDISCSLINDT